MKGANYTENPMVIHGEDLCRTETGAAFLGGYDMETRVAVMSIIVEDIRSADKINTILHEYGEYIIGRMGVPYRKRNISIISVALDAPQNTLASLAGKIGGLNGVSVKTAYSSIISKE